MKKIVVGDLKTIDGKPFVGPENKTLDLKDMLKLLVFNLPPQSLTMQDSIEAHRLIKQIEQSENGLLAVEDGVYDWVKKNVETHAPKIFGVNACVMKEAIENIEKAHQPKESGGN